MAQSKSTLRNAVDTFAASNNPSANWADAKTLQVESGVANSFVFFNRPFPLGATIVSATLRLYTATDWNATRTVTVKAATEHWGVNRLTWNNRPAVGFLAASVTQSSTGVDDEWAFDVTAHLQRISDGAVWYGFRVETTAATRLKLWSADAHDHKPTLEVTWSSAPQAPTTLTPSGSQAVSIAKPTLRFDFSDNRGSTALQAVQAQVDAGGNFATPAFDSGTVLVTEPELDLAATAYAGLTAGQETRWRVRVQDGAGLWSEWSDVVRFRRDVKGTLSIDNPPVSGIVSEWTPPIIWGLTGETQAAWQVFVTPDDDPGTRLYDTGRTKGADTSWTLPKAVIEDDSDYRVVVRTWDTKERVSNPGDPVYTQAVRTFHFNEDPTPNHVTALAMAALPPTPDVALTWDRSTAPDSFAIKRNGKVIESGIDPADVLQSGTSYRWVDRDAGPYRTHEWVVQSVVNGKTSTGNPSVTGQGQTQGIWLHCFDLDLDVWIAGSDDGTWAMGEEATTHNPVGSSRGIRVTQALRGWEGTISGTLTRGAGKSAEAWEDNLMRIKAHPGRVCRLTLGNEAFRCVLGNIASWPTPTVPITKGVSFDFFATGGLPYRVRW